MLWNGKPARSVAAEGGQYVLREEGYSPAGLVKTPEVEGPMRVRCPDPVSSGTVTVAPASGAPPAVVAWTVSVRVVLDEAANRAGVADRWAASLP